MRNAGSQEVKWEELVDKLTIAGHTHQTAAELYAEIDDHMPLVNEVSRHLYRSRLLPLFEVLLLSSSIIVYDSQMAVW